MRLAVPGISEGALVLAVGAQHIAYRRRSTTLEITHIDSTYLVATAAALFFFVVKPMDAIKSRMAKPTETEVTDEERRHQELLVALARIER